MRRPIFTAHWVICLICAGAFAFAWHYGIQQKIWASEARWMSCVIAAWFLFSVARIGLLAWRSDNGPVDTRFGPVAYEMSVILGVLGMAIGLSWQGQNIAANGTAIFGAWAIQLYSTILGVGCGAILYLMSHMLESGRKP